MLVWKDVKLDRIGEDVRNRTRTHCKWERLSVLAFQWTIGQYLIHIPYASAIPFLDIHSGESLVQALKEATKRMLVTALLVKHGNNHCLSWRN